MSVDFGTFILILFYNPFRSSLHIDDHILLVLVLKDGSLRRKREVSQGLSVYRIIRLCNEFMGQIARLELNISIFLTYLGYTYMGTLTQMIWVLFLFLFFFFFFYGNIRDQELFCTYIDSKKFPAGLTGWRQVEGSI